MVREEIVCVDNKGEGSFRNKQERMMFAVQTGIVDSFQLSPSSIRDGVNTIYCLDRGRGQPKTPDKIYCTMSALALNVPGLSRISPPLCPQVVQMPALEPCSTSCTLGEGGAGD